MKRWLIGISALFSIVALLAVASSWWALRRTQVVPDFYTQAAKALPADLDSAVVSLQEDVIQLRGDASKLGSWNATFTDDQINAWLAQQLEIEFPQLLPPGVIEPRILIDNGKVMAAARYQNHHIDTVVSCEVSVALTEQANVLAIRISNLRAGALPLPLASFLRGISQEAAKSDLEVRWDLGRGGPIALVTIPSEHPGYLHSPVIVESVNLNDGLLLLAGNTGTEARQAFKPQGPVYHLASATLLSATGWMRNSNRHDKSSTK